MKELESFCEEISLVDSLKTATKKFVDRFVIGNPLDVGNALSEGVQDNALSGSRSHDLAVESAAYKPFEHAPSF